MYNFPFELDDFQKEACECISNKKSVVVCAPTGAGKTVIAQHAIHCALQEGKKVFYTTPLKALSNQKFNDFSEKYGADKVGLLTKAELPSRTVPSMGIRSPGCTTITVPAGTSEGSSCTSWPSCSTFA